MPDPTEIGKTQEAQITAVCNTDVEKAITLRKRKRSEYGTYTRAKQARYAIENFPAKAVRHFSKELGKEVNEALYNFLRVVPVKISWAFYRIHPVDGRKNLNNMMILSKHTLGD